MARTKNCRLSTKIMLKQDRTNWRMRLSPKGGPSLARRIRASPTHDRRRDGGNRDFRSNDGGRFLPQRTTVNHPYPVVASVTVCGRHLRVPEALYQGAPVA